MVASSERGHKNRGPAARARALLTDPRPAMRMLNAAVRRLLDRLERTNSAYEELVLSADGGAGVRCWLRHCRHMTALGLVVWNRLPQAVRLLIEEGAPVSIAAVHGACAHEVAARMTEQFFVPDAVREVLECAERKSVNHNESLLAWAGTCTETASQASRLRSAVVAEYVKALRRATELGSKWVSAADDEPSPEARALGVLCDHEDWTNAQIAAKARCSREFLSRSRKFKAARAAQRTRLAFVAKSATRSDRHERKDGVRRALDGEDDVAD